MKDFNKLPVNSPERLRLERAHWSANCRHVLTYSDKRDEFARLKSQHKKLAAEVKILRDVVESGAVAMALYGAEENRRARAALSAFDSAKAKGEE
jgi:hypothetical protein